MSYRSNVRMKMGKDAYKILKEEVLKSDKDYVREMIEKPDVFIKCDEDDYIIIGWSYVKWYASFEDVKTINTALVALDEMVEEDPDLIETYFYKMIIIGEDNATEEFTNDCDEEFTDDFYVKVDFSM